MDSRKIKDSSANIYVKNIERLRNKLNLKTDELGFLTSKSEDIFKIINSMKSLQTKKIYLASIVVVLRALKKDDTKQFEKYNKEMFALQKEYNDSRKNQEKSVKQEKNWISYSELLNVYKYYKNKIKIKKLRKKTELNAKELDLLKRYIILSLYIGDPKNNPPRRIRDYANMEITKKKPDEKNKENYLYVKNSRNKEFIFNNFKTSQKYGKQQIKVGKNINNDLNLWLKFNKSKYLLPNETEEGPITGTTLTKILQKIFLKQVGKKISVNMIRSIILTEIYKDVPKIKQLEDIATNMGHSMQEAMETYVKKD